MENDNPKIVENPRPWTLFGVEVSEEEGIAFLKELVKQDKADKELVNKWFEEEWWWYLL